MKLPGMVFLIFWCLPLLFSYEDLGPVADARKKYPEIFIPGSVHIVSIASKPCYVFSGEAEQCFTGDFAEPESELYDEATLAAKNNFYEYLTKGKKTLTVSMSQCSILYRFHDKKIYTVILFVPKANVSIRDSAPALPSVSAPAASAGVSAGNSSASVAAVPGRDTVSPPAESASAPAMKSSFERRAAKYLQQMEKDPRDVIACSGLAWLYLQNGDSTKALFYFRKTVALTADNPFFDNAEKIRIILQTAKLSESLGKNHLALKYYYFLLKHDCPKEYCDAATAAISKIRLKMLP